ncbi:MAG: hypothetical protein IJU84_06640 [Clostridia bacterium]|nr:hypothetical protein [Clostridia bacterium]
MKEYEKLLEGKNIRILPYAHCDYAALHTRFWHENRYKQIFDSVMDYARSMPEFRWYFDCYRAQLETLFEKYPEKETQFKKYIESGKINFTGAYANIRPNMVGEATYLKNFETGRKILSYAVCNVYSEEIDVALGHAQVPQILSQYGYDLYKVYRPNDVMDAKNIPSSFIWEGFDGSRICVVRGDYSCFDRQGTENVNTREEAEKYLFDNAENCLKFSDTDLVWLSCGCDDVPPFITNQANNDGKVYDVDIPKIINLCKNGCAKSVKISSPREFADELNSRKDKLKTIRGTIDCSDVSYNISLNGEKGFVPMRIRADELLVTAERWQYFAKRAGINLLRDFEDDWKTLLTACSHATQWLFTEDYIKIRASLENLIYKTERYISKIHDEIAKKINAGENNLKTVFNDTQFEGYRNVTVTVPCTDIEKLSLSDGRGEKVNFFVKGKHDYLNTWEYVLVCRIYLPAYGYNTIRAEKGDVRGLFGKHVEPKQHVTVKKIVPELTVSGGGYDLIFKNGDLVSVNGLFSGGRPFNGVTLKNYAYHGSWAETETNEFSDAKFTRYKIIRADENILDLNLYGKTGNLDLVQNIYAEKGAEKLSFRISVNWKKANAFLFASVPADDLSAVKCDIPFATDKVNVAREYSDGAFGKYFAHRRRKGVIYAKRYVSSSLSGKPVTILRENTDRYFLCDTERNTLGIILLNSIIRKADTWEEDINDDIEAEGKHELCYSIIFDTPSEENITLSEQRIYLSDYARADERNTLPPYKSLFSYCNKPEGVIMVYLRETEEGFSVCFTETCGKKSNVDICAEGYSRCRSVKLNGDIISEVEKEENAFRYTLKPFEIVTLIITR